VPHVLAHIFLNAAWRMNLEGNCLKYVVLPNLGISENPLDTTSTYNVYIVDHAEITALKPIQGSHGLALPSCVTSTFPS